jgi:hypothetical protein
MKIYDDFGTNMDIEFYTDSLLDDGKYLLFEKRYMLKSCSSLINNDSLSDFILSGWSDSEADIIWLLNDLGYEE